MAVVPLREGGGLGYIGPSPNRVTKNASQLCHSSRMLTLSLRRARTGRAASVQMPPIERAPAWISSDLYTIDAKAEGAPGQPAMLGPMMQSLLEDRFHLKLHRETRSGPAYELTVAKGGSRLRTNNGVCSVDVPPAAAPRDPATGRPVPGFAGGHVSAPSQPGVPCRLMLNLTNGQNELFISRATDHRPLLLIPVPRYGPYRSSIGRDLKTSTISAWNTYRIRQLREITLAVRLTRRRILAWRSHCSRQWSNNSA